MVWSKSLSDGLQSGGVFETVNKNKKKGKWQGNGDFKHFCEEKGKISDGWKRIRARKGTSVFHYLSGCDCTQSISQAQEPKGKRR